MLPSSIMTFLSLTQAPSTFLKVLVARAMPCWIASSKPFSEIALISVTVATLISSVESPLFWMLTTTTYIFAYHLKGEAKHIDGRLLNTHRQRPIAPPRLARTAGEEILISSGIMCQAAPGTKGPRRRPGQYSGWDHTPSFAATRESYPSRGLLQRCYTSASRG